MKKSLLALSIVASCAVSNTYAFDLPIGAHLSIISDSAAGTGSRFTVDAGITYTYLSDEKGIIVGANSGDESIAGGIANPTGSGGFTIPHAGFAHEDDVGSVTQPWNFFFSTGYNYLSSSTDSNPVGSNSFTGGTVGGVDMSSWVMAWNTSPTIPVGGCQFGDTADNAGFSGCDQDRDGVDDFQKTAAQLVSESIPHVNTMDTDTGVGEFTWDGTDGGTYTITHSAHVPAVHPSGFIGALYELQLTGVVTLPVIFLSTFSDVTTVNRNTVQTSNSIIVSGVSTTASINVTGGSYQINGGGFVTPESTVTNGDIVQVQHTSSAVFNTSIDTILTFGVASHTYTSTTFSQDITPDAFTFIDETGVALSSTQTDSIVVSGINDAVSISIIGGSYQINGTGFTTNSGNVNNGDAVEVQHTSSAGFSENVEKVLTIGSVSDTFTTTTSAQDTVPDAFVFIDDTGVALSSTQTGTIVVSGINDATTISIVGGSYQINGAGFTTISGIVSNGDTVEVQHTSLASFNEKVDTVLTIGSVSDTYSSTTVAQDLVLDALSFTTNTNVTLNSVRTSDAITVLGISGSVPITVLGGSYQINGVGGFATDAGTLVNGDTVELQHIASSIKSTTVITTVTISNVDIVFSSTTVGDALPIATNDSGLIDVSVATSFSLDVTANDYDPDGAIDRSTVVVVSPAANGSTSVDSVAGVVTYTPTPEFIGTDSFTYTINDVFGNTSLAGRAIISVADSAIAAGLPSDALLLFRLGRSRTTNPVDGNGSYYSLDVDGGPLLITPLTNDVGLQIGTSQFATGSHGGPPDGSELSNIDQPWSFLNNTGMKQTVTPVTILTDDGNGNVTLDLSGWSMTWNGIDSIPINTEAHSGGLDGVAQFKCDDKCAFGDTYILNYYATIQHSPLHAFGGVPYTLHLEGTIARGFVPVMAPVVSSEFVALAPNGSITIDLTDNVFDVFANANIDIDFSTIIVTSPNLYDGTLVDNGDGTLIFTDFDGADALYSFIYSVSNTNGETSNQQVVNINISSGNLPPTASSFAMQVEPVNPTLIDVSGFVADDSAIDVTSVSASQSINGNAVTSVDAVTGIITYTPNAGFVGDDSFSFTVRDDAGVTSNIALVTVFVNEPPVANDDIVSVDRNSFVDINVPLNDTDTDGTINFSTVVLETLPLDGTATLDAATGVVTYTPNNNYLGADTFDYTVRDNAGAISNAGTVDITVSNASPIAVVLPSRPEFNGTNPSVISIDIDVTANDTDADGAIDPASVVITSDVSNGSTSLDPITGIVTYTPTTGFIGLDQFT